MTLFCYPQYARVIHRSKYLPWDKDGAQCPPCRYSAMFGPPQEGRIWLYTGVLVSGCRTLTRYRAPWGPVWVLRPSPPCWETLFLHRGPAEPRKTCCCWSCSGSSPPDGKRSPAPLKEHRAAGDDYTSHCHDLKINSSFKTHSCRRIGLIVTGAYFRQIWFNVSLTTVAAGRAASYALCSFSQIF